jgi:hypothetical protein
MHGEKRGAYRGLGGKLEVRDVFEDPGVDGKIILNISQRNRFGAYGLD